MNNNDLMKCMARLMDAYKDMSVRLKKMEREMETMRKQRDGKNRESCRIYKMEIPGMASGK